jgi:hypothetical protein
MPVGPSNLLSKPRTAISPSQEELEAWELYKENEIRKLPKWRQALMGAVEGLLGLEFKPWDKATTRDNVNFAVQLIQAGLPFSAIMKGRSVYHGTPYASRIAKEGFDPSQYNKEDTLGWLTHFAEDPTYASSYAAKTGRGGSIIPVKLGAQNVLDLIEPNIDDLAQAMASIRPEQRKHLLSLFRYTKRLIGERHPLGSLSQVIDLSSRAFKGAKIEDIPARAVAQKLRLNEEEFNRTPFDAIRYHDINERSWAVKPEVINRSTTSWGAPLSSKIIPEKRSRRFIGDPSGVVRNEILGLEKALDNKPSHLSASSGQKVVDDPNLKPELKSKSVVTKPKPAPGKSKYVVFDPSTTEGYITTFDTESEALNFISKNPKFDYYYGTPVLSPKDLVAGQYDAIGNPHEVKYVVWDTVKEAFDFAKSKPAVVGFTTETFPKFKIGDEIKVISGPKFFPGQLKAVPPKMKLHTKQHIESLYKFLDAGGKVKILGK